MRAVGRIVPVVPVPLMATVFARDPGRVFASIELKTEVERIVERLERSAARVYVPRRDLDYALDAGLHVLLLRRLVDEREGGYVARDAELPLLRYYANSIAHLVEDESAR
jgi:glycerol-3-phosphate O-acyltransferase